MLKAKLRHDNVVQSEAELLAEKKCVAHLTGDVCIYLVYSNETILIEANLSCFMDVCFRASPSVILVR